MSLKEKDISWECRRVFERRLDKYMKEVLVRKSVKHYDDAPYFWDAWKAVQELKNDYDAVVAIARDGLRMGLLFELIDELPVHVVEMYRTEESSTWNPTDSLKLDGKSVLILEHDVRKGLTIQKAAKEIQCLKPKRVDLLLEKHEVIEYRHAERPEREKVIEGAKDITGPKDGYYGYKRFDVSHASFPDEIDDIFFVHKDFEGGVEEVEDLFNRLKEL